MDDFINLRHVASALIRRWWLILIFITTGALGGYGLSLLQTPYFQSTTVLQVGPIFQNTDLDRQDLLTSESVALTYSNVIRRQPVLQGVVESLNLGITWQQLREKISVDLVEGAQLIQISVEAQSPFTAQKIADEVARQMILFTTAGPGTAESIDYQPFVQTQLQNLETRITNGQNRLVALGDELIQTESIERISALQAEQNTLLSLITTWESSYTQLLNYLASTKSPATLNILEPAQADLVAVRPQVYFFIFIGGILGFFLSLGAVFILEYLDDTIKTSEEITKSLGVPVIGIIGEAPDNKEWGIRVFNSDTSHPPAEEAYRLLSTNIEFSRRDRPIKSLLVLSCDQDPDKSFVSLNLATAMAEKNKKVLLLDADLRNPKIHRLTSLANKAGLQDVVQNETTISKVVQIIESKKFGVITSGSSSLNPTAVFSSNGMDIFLKKARENSDIVIIDGPEGSLNDMLILTARVDGVLVVVKPGSTTKKSLFSFLEHLKITRPNIVGVVLNNVEYSAVEHYGGYAHMLTKRFKDRFTSIKVLRANDNSSKSKKALLLKN